MNLTTPVSAPCRFLLRSPRCLLWPLCLFGLLTSTQPLGAADPTPAAPSPALTAKEPSDRPAMAKRLLRAALKEAGGIKDSEGQANALSSLAGTLSEAGDMGLALDTAGTIKDVSIRVGSYVSIVTGAIKAGNTDVARDALSRAKKSAASIRDPEERSTELGIIATSQIEAGDQPGARETAAAMLPGPEQVNALGQAGDFPGARRAAVAIKDLETRANLLGNLVRAQAQAGDIAGARETVTDIKPPERRPEGLAEIGIAQRKAGDLEGAKATFLSARKLAAEILDPGERTSALTSVAVAQANAGDLDGAEETSMISAPGDSRCEVLTAVARALLGLEEPGD